jgi:alcohol dehydrogenase class IV
MVASFQFARLPLIYFGNGKVATLPALLEKFGKSVLLVTGKNSFINSARGKTLFGALYNSGVSSSHVIISEEPSPGKIDEVVKDLEDTVIHAVVSIGGGSVIDAGKAISAMMYKNEPLTDYLEVVGNKNHPGTRLPFIAVPTTSGTGSEVTKNAVISKVGMDGFKRSLRHDNLVPDIALIDPELTLGCPADITAASGMDCFTQLTEAFLSVKSNDYTDALAIEGLKKVKSSLIGAYINGDDIAAREGMSFAALTSGICLANSGLGAVHGFASSIGGMYNIPHGVICGTLMAKANEVNVRELRKITDNKTGLKKYALLGELFLEEMGKSDDFYIDGFIQYLHDITEKLHLSGLKGYGLEEKNLELICRNTEIKNNPVKLAEANLYEIILGRL